MSLLLTYGTLMRNQRNHWRLLGSKFLTEATITGRLYHIPVLNFPVLRRTGSQLVHGEIYEVDRDVLAVQDHFEAWYKRIRVMAQPASGPPVLCWVYEGLDCLPLGLARRLYSGRWPEYRT
jgi:gamma-glutamylcyclotransferase (GGCT)/AIG2-like uncharacterized protein YtfP